jgi:transposase
MTATHDENSPLPAAPVLDFSLELGSNTWKLAFTIGAGQKPRLRTIRARALDVLLVEIQAALARFGLPGDAKAISYYEAGRDGFWLDRFLPRTPWKVKTREETRSVSSRSGRRGRRSRSQ